MFFYAGRNVDEWLLSERILPHEFSHHFQFAEGFPCLMPKGAPKELLSQFTKCCELGPEKGSLYVDELFLDVDLVNTMKDFSERVADHICEGILLEKGFTEGMFEEYCKDRSHDPAKDYPQFGPTAKAVIRYVRRLALYDAAEWHTYLQLAYPKDSKLKRTLRHGREWILNLNQDYGKAEQAFEQICDISLNTSPSSLKVGENMVHYVKAAMRLLGINVETDEQW